MSSSYVNIIFYDLPSISHTDRKNYRNFRKRILNLGYYQLQESVYCKSYKEKVLARRTIKHLKYIAPDVGNIRALTVSKKTFEGMEIIVGKESIEEKIIMQKTNVIEM